MQGNNSVDILQQIARNLFYRQHLQFSCCGLRWVRLAQRSPQLSAISSQPDGAGEEEDTETRRRGDRGRSRRGFSSLAVGSFCAGNHRLSAASFWLSATWGRGLQPGGDARVGDLTALAFLTVQQPDSRTVQFGFQRARDPASPQLRRASSGRGRRSGRRRSARGLSAGPVAGITRRAPRREG